MAPFQKLLLAIFAIVIVGITFSSVIVYHDYKRSDYYYQKIADNANIFSRLNRLASDTKEYQIESNSFLLTGDSSFLVSCLAIRPKIEDTITGLENYMKANRQFATYLQPVLSSAGHFVEFTAAYLSASSGKINTGALISKFRKGNLYLDTINNALAQMNKANNELNQVYVTKKNSYAAAFKTTFLLTISGAFILLAIAFLAVRYNFQKRILSEKQLRTQEHRMRLLIDNLKDYAVLLLDKNGQIISWNKGAENLTGYKEDEVVGKHISIFYPREAVQRGDPESNLETARQKGHFETEDWRLHKQGSLYWADVIITPVYDNNDELQGFTKITRDNTERKKAADEMQIALEKERDLNKLKSSFVSMASHEFRNPLSAISSSVFLLEKYIEIGQDDKRNKQVERIRYSIKNMIHILDEFLSVGKIEEGSITVKKETFDFAGLVQDIVNEVGTALKAVQNINNNHTGEKLIFCDREFLSHILTNLISNAIKYSPQDSTIHIQSQTVDSMIAISIRDEGIGIPQEDQKHLFERFFRASNVGSKQGTGLGLYIIKRYVDMLNGNIAVKSYPEQGTEFIIHIPLH